MGDQSSSEPTKAKKSAAIKSETGVEHVEEGAPETVSSANVDMVENSMFFASEPRGYDDTLKDVSPGRYGRIIVRESGKTELVIGGGADGSPEVHLLIHEGLQCGFSQEAVSIDPSTATFVSLGDVNKSLVVTPDVEKAFVS